MLSFLQQLRTTADNGAHKKKVDLSTSGESAHVYKGGGGVRASSLQIIPKDATRIRVDRSARHLDGRVDYGHIFSLELPDSIIGMDANLTQGTSCLGPSKAVQAMQTMVASYKPRDVFKGECMRNLRNVAFPPDLCDKDLPTFDTSSTDLGRVLPAKRNSDYIYRCLCNGYALRTRFDGLPVHRVCYYHSHDSAEVAIRNLSRELGQSDMLQRGKDCIGMTPLHILACSTKHHLDMFRLLITSNPEQLVTEDAWGEIPLSYAIWGRAPREVVELLAAGMKEFHALYLVDWEKMLGTFCRGLAPIPCVKYMIEVVDSIFPNQTLQGVDWNQMVRLLCTNAKASEEHVQRFISVYSDALPKNKSDLESLSLDLAREEKFGFKPFWLRIGIYKRLSSLDKKEWREEIESLIETCPTGSSRRNTVGKRLELMKDILHRLTLYEIVAQMWVLELALWKAKIGGSEKANKSYRSRCQIMCGADVIVPNVMGYLIHICEK